MNDALNHRVKAFCDWLDTIPADPPFHSRPEFKFFADLNDAQIALAMREMRRRGAAALAEASKLKAEIERRRSTEHIAVIDTTREQDRR